jgi:ABC-type phosphate transport system substrate-binding protein
MTSRRRTWFLIRLAVYVTAIAVLFVVRSGVDLRPVRQLLSTASAADSTLTIAGRDLAPALIDGLVAEYRRDFPALAVALTAGGTNQSLENLLNRQADVAFLYRPPTAAEQAQLRTLDGDTAVVVPVAVGGLAVITADAAAMRSLTVSQVAAAVTGGGGDTARVYAPDPNEGAWDALRQRLGLPGEGRAAGLIFLTDTKAVVDAVVADPGSLGLVSTFTLADDMGVRRLAVGAAPGDTAAAPTFTNLVTGAYPLYHWLYVACRARGGIQGTKFVTHLASARGQRQVEHAGVVPARQVAREIVLTREPLGGREAQ